MPLNFGTEYVRLNAFNKTNSKDDGPDADSTNAFSGFSARDTCTKSGKTAFFVN